MDVKQWDKLWINATVCTCENGYGLVTQAALASKDGSIAWVGPLDRLSGSPEDLAEEVIDVNHRLITPGLIDCHSHIVYAGDRAHEFEMRLQGKTYEEIAKQGGGIQSTVLATRKATEDELFEQSVYRAHALMMSGVTTIEIKSGYGLDWETEAKMLRVAKRIGEFLPLSVQTTFLGAHTIPVEYRKNPDNYIDIVCNEMIPRVAKEELADAVDVFCESIAFSLEQTERVFKAAREHGLAIKCHAEQLSNMGCAKLASEYGALSVDHLEYLTDEDVAALKKSGTVAVLLPGAYYFLREKQLPPINALRVHQIPIAIASDCNPGTSPVLSLLLMMNMSSTLFSLTPEEVLMGVTAHASQALGLQELIGTLTVGKAADLAIWEVEHPVELAYYIGGNPLAMLVKSGELVVSG